MKHRGDEDLGVIMYGPGVDPYLSLRAWRDETQRERLAALAYEGCARPDEDDFEKMQRLFFDEPSMVRLSAGRVRSGPVPIGRFEGDPRVSVPALVAEVSAQYGIDEDAAALYLLTLVHPAPKRTVAQAILGWKNAAYQAAGGALVQAELCVQAKRAGAGRDYFLPGPWQKKEKIERWKQRFYEAERTEDPLQTMPYFVAFERAWARLKSGDVPRFDGVGQSR